MRNDNERWDPPSPVAFASKGVVLEAALLPVQHWVSGSSVLGRYKDSLVSWPDVAEAEDYALVLRRDRILFVGAVDQPPGYSETTSLAVSDVSDAFDVVDVSGSNAFACLRRGAELDLARPSKSVARRLFGVEVALYRFGEPERFRVHIPRAQIASVVAGLKAAAQQL